MHHFENLAIHKIVPLTGRAEAFDQVLSKCMKRRNQPIIRTPHLELGNFLPCKSILLGEGKVNVPV